MTQQMSLHMGRAWSGHDIEDKCPCPKAPCGLITNARDDCRQHSWDACKTMRQGHYAELCPALEDSEP